MISESQVEPLEMSSLEEDNEIARILASVPEFVKKLFRILEKDTYKKIIHWSDSGDSFVVIDQSEFSDFVLPRHFKHKNFATFIRQLNKYGFRKVKSRYESKKAGDLVWEFEHPYFQSKSPNMLDKIKRKPIGRTRNTQQSPAHISSNSTIPSKSFKPDKQEPKNQNQSTSFSENPSAEKKSTSPSRPIEEDDLRLQVQNLINENSQVVNYLKQLSEHYQYITNEVGNLKKSIHLQDGCVSQSVSEFPSAVSYNFPKSSKKNFDSEPRLPNSLNPDFQMISNVPFDNLNINEKTPLSDNFCSSTPSPQFKSSASFNDVPNFDTSAKTQNLNPNFNSTPVLNQSDFQSTHNSFENFISLSKLGSISDAKKSKNRTSSHRIDNSGQKNPASNDEISSRIPDGSHVNTNQEDSIADLCKYAGISQFSLFQPNIVSYDVNNSSHPSEPTILPNPTKNSKRQRINDKEDNYRNLKTNLVNFIRTPSEMRPTSNGKGIEFFKFKKRNLNKKNPFVAINWTAPPKVLIVEDGEVDRDLANRLLNIFGCSTDLANDGSAAVTLMNEHQYDIVLMDIFMPNLDGMAATSFIRSFDKETPIISVTSAADDKSRTKYVKEGMTDVLEKPLTKELVYSLLITYCSHLFLTKTSIGITMLSDSSEFGARTANDFNKFPRMREIQLSNSDPKINKTSNSVSMTQSSNKKTELDDQRMPDQQNSNIVSHQNVSIVDISNRKNSVIANESQNFSNAEKNSPFFFNDNNSNYLKHQNGPDFSLVKTPLKSNISSQKAPNGSSVTFSHLNGVNVLEKDYLNSNRAFHSGQPGYLSMNSNNNGFELKSSVDIMNNKKDKNNFQGQDPISNDEYEFISPNVVSKNNISVAPANFLQLPNYSNSNLGMMNERGFPSEKPQIHSSLLSLGDASAFGNANKDSGSVLINEPNQIDPRNSDSGANSIYNNISQQSFSKDQRESQFVALSNNASNSNNFKPEKHQKFANSNSFEVFGNQQYMENESNNPRYGISEFGDRDITSERNININSNHNFNYYNMSVPPNQNIN
ncbi:Transcription factor SKN7 [Smittium mucronatum]|uniref:Transcription factor SKN7 n=1 Tax=Smittium mucronatum TaxID=133383 RepID=A0A1R0GTY5_9FUNG|nr:Transcription factor SKN7 [Smittium mucronatum]